MKIICYLLLLTIVIIGCHSEKGIKIDTTTSIGRGEQSKRTDSISYVNTPYFEVDLKSVAQGKYYIATQDLKQSQGGEAFMVSFFTIIKESGEAEEFSDSAAFLNYMVSHGYEMAQQDKKRFSTHYTFKKK